MSPLPCPSSIRRVCVHARGALVTRKVDLGDLPPGSCEVLLEGITAEADPGSFRVEVLGGRQVNGLQVSYGYAQSPSRQAADQAQVETLRQRTKALELSAAQVQHERELLRTTNPHLDLERQGVEPATRVQDGIATAALLHELLGAAEARLVEIARERRAIERELSELLRHEDRPPSSEVQTQVTISLGPELSPVDAFSLTYVVQAARWWPCYSARLEAGGRQGTWLLNAVLAQDSGEDWSSVELALSTADLVNDARLPELKARRLGRAQPAKSKGYRAPPEGLDALFQGYERALAGAGQAAPVLDSATFASSSVLQVFGAMGSDPFSGEEQEEALEDRYGTGAYAAIQESNDYFDSDDELEGYGLGAGAAPPPPPAPAPSVSAMSASFGAAAPPGGMPVPRPDAKMRKRSASRSGGGGAPSVPSQPPLPEPPLEPADAWLDFDRLVLQGRTAGAGSRGRLTKAPLSLAGRGAGQQRVEGLSGPPHARDPRSERGSFDFQFEARGLADVPSGGALTQVGVQEFPVDVRQVLTVVPVLDEVVYREAELTNPLEFPLLAGPVEVYLNGSLLTTTALEKVGRGGIVRFGLGAEERVRVARNVRTKEETSGLIGKTTAVEHSVTLELRSSLPSAATLRLVDRVPVVESGEDDVAVKLLPGEPPPKRYTQEERGARLKGGLLWELELGAGERREVSFGYVLELPAKREIVGGNRRD